MTDKERIARDIGWLQGFAPMVWALVGEQLADEMAATYDDVVDDLHDLLLGKEGEED